MQSRNPELTSLFSFCLESLRLRRGKFAESVQFPNRKHPETFARSRATLYTSCFIEQPLQLHFAIYSQENWRENRNAIVQWSLAVLATKSRRWIPLYRALGMDVRARTHDPGQSPVHLNRKRAARMKTADCHQVKGKAPAAAPASPRVLCNGAQTIPRLN